MAAETEIVKVPYRIEVNYDWSYGRISKFFAELRDNKKIFGTKCPKCKVTYCPPTSDCPKCWVPIEWVELSSQGTLMNYTTIGIPALWLDVKPPYTLGLIKLDGADTGLLHFVLDVDVDKIKTGMRVEAVFKDKRDGYITDIAYFKPIST
jgi:uncharacterized OB-fold protein